MATETLRVENLQKSFGNHAILRGVSFEATAGSVLALLGPNGSGKSTLLRTLNLLEPYQHGSIALSEEKLSVGTEEPEQSSLSPIEIRRRVGIVFQQLNLFPHMNLLRNVMVGPLLGRNLPRAEAQQIAERCLQRVGLFERKNVYPGILSGGQKQRVAIARALALNPKVILFDEPTAALDPQYTHETGEIIQELRSEGIIVIVVTHDIDFARTFSDQTIYLEGGQIVVQGPTAETLVNSTHQNFRKFIDQPTN